MLLTGWGRSTAGRSRLVAPSGAEELRALIAGKPAAGLLARGAGLSYGDAALNTGGLVVAPVPSPEAPRIALDAAAGTVRACASVTFAELLAHTVPHGWLPPVLPGTRHLTVGGAVAADVHGKNQYREGALASGLTAVELLDGTGTVRSLTPDREPAAFRATVGGMGLTGVVLGATLRLLPIRSALLRVTTERAADLDALLAGLAEAAERHRYAVGWIDGTAGGRSLGRGIVEAGDHLPAPDPRREPAGIRYAPGPVLPAPRLPFSPVRPLTARAFNALWYRKAPPRREGTVTASAFFHRLDAVAHWSRALGPAGIWQYQFVVPDASAPLLAQVVEGLRRAGAATFLGTLKRFGAGDGHPLSFPRAGWSLALDMPAGRRHTAELLDHFDRQVAAAGGRVYLAKDARMDRGCLRDMYGPLEDFQEARAELDPHGVFRSDLGRRLGLCG
ncbi:FAD-binding protein [Phaeacidiphilus oryzae]|uniref:FAD-binding protein n=1 Tax=Phaeacidiphilus oryzae TaxID=348818 RepID=UPI00055FD408|nr:FAD-binding oxidoreductase [Phaeacidiphilus oryzae]